MHVGSDNRNDQVITPEKSSGTRGKLSRRLRSAILGLYLRDPMRILQCEEKAEPGQAMTHGTLPGCRRTSSKIDPSINSTITKVGPQLSQKAWKRPLKPQTGLEYNNLKEYPAVHVNKTSQSIK
jgi:hypothetical protein